MNFVPGQATPLSESYDVHRKMNKDMDDDIHASAAMEATFDGGGLEIAAEVMDLGCVVSELHGSDQDAAQEVAEVVGLNTDFNQSGDFLLEPGAQGVQEERHLSSSLEPSYH